MFRSMMTPRLWVMACAMAFLQACGGGGGGSDGPSRPTWEVASIGPGGGNSLHHVVFRNGRFVAVSSQGDIVTSADGQSWTTAVSDHPHETNRKLPIPPRDAPARCLAHHGGMFNALCKRSLS
jgi:hypothetical protein